VPQAARFLGIGRSKLYEFINAGEIESVKIGGSTVIPVESLKSFLERCRSS
jgi:excisionase family DNA binding protein